MAFDPHQAVMLIPSLEPDERLPAYVEALLARGFAHVVIVDDGSSEKYQPIFSRMAEMAGCTVLHHEVNRGKGAALKTGYAHISSAFPEACGVITADADGQHAVEDCWRLAEALCQGKDELYLGSRDFSLPHVPKKSRYGNKITSCVFKVLYGQWLPDTQTGLRAFPAARLEFMQQVTGDRFEYEMNVLIACARAGIAMVPVTIETIYENDNSGSHFHPFRDSYRIYKVLLGSFLKYSGSSILCGLLDYGLLQLLESLVFHSVPHGEFFAKVIARCVSAPCNFLLNGKFVFGGKISGKTALRYAALAIPMMLISAFLLDWVMSLLQLPEALTWLVSLVVDAVLYVVSYRIQHRWVFPEEGKPHA